MLAREAGRGITRVNASIAAKMKKPTSAFLIYAPPHFLCPISQISGSRLYRSDELRLSKRIVNAALRLTRKPFFQIPVLARLFRMGSQVVPKRHVASPELAAVRHGVQMVRVCAIGREPSEITAHRHRDLPVGIVLVPDRHQRLDDAIQVVCGDAKQHVNNGLGRESLDCCTPDMFNPAYTRAQCSEDCGFVLLKDLRPAWIILDNDDTPTPAGISNVHL